MDDFNVSSLHESKNEWGSRLLTILTPHVVDGLKSIFDEALKLCRDNNEIDKYLMTFQNFITRIPQWNANIIEGERRRIVERSGCGYLEDLVTCVHIIQLKLLSAIRVGKKQKKIDINIPKLDDFIHKIYVNVARKIYKNVYLFEVNVPPLQTQKHLREIELIVQECILNTVRDSIPVEAILQAYMDETVEEEVEEEVKEEVIPEVDVKEEDKEKIRQLISETDNLNSEAAVVEENQFKQLESNTIQDIIQQHNLEEQIKFPSLTEVEEVVSAPSVQQQPTRSLYDDYDSKVKILDHDINLDRLDVHNLDDVTFPEMKLDDTLLLNDIEVLA
jgi:Family of unknown function (DUF5764)